MTATEYAFDVPTEIRGGVVTMDFTNAGQSIFLTVDLEAGVEYTAIDFTTESIETFSVS